MNYVNLFLILFIIIFVINSKVIEKFELESCSLDEKIKGDEKVKGDETVKGDEKVKENDKLYQILNKINENLKLITLKLNDDDDDDDDDGDDDDDENTVYSKLNQFNDKFIQDFPINSLLLFMAVLFMILISYSIYNFVKSIYKRRKVNIKKINLSYNEVLDSLKKNKLKGKINIKDIQK